MKKFWQKHKAAIIAFLLALIGAEGFDFAQTVNISENGVNVSEALKMAETAETPETITFEVTFYAKQKGTPDNIYVRDTFKADSLPPLDKIMAGVAVPEGYDVNQSLPIYVREIFRHEKVIPKPPVEKEPETAPEPKKPTKDEKAE